MFMFDLDKWGEIFQALTRNKARSLLTAFGIFWGTFMLVLLMGGSKGLKAMMQSNFDGFAQNSYMAYPELTTKAYGGFQVGRQWNFEKKDLKLLRRHLPEADVITPLHMQWGQNTEFRDRKMSCTIKGVAPEYADIENPKLSQGRYIQDIDLQNHRKVCVIGKRVAKELFPNGENPLGKFIKIANVYYQVLGVSQLDNKIGIGGGTSKAIYIPLTTFQRINNTGDDIGSIAITMRPGSSVNAVQPIIERLLKKTHRVHPDDEQALMSFNMEAMFQMVQSLFDGINILVWLIGIGTLISGSIGVSNIMMVVVKERTTEIGIRRAIGAHPSHILSQILSESAVITIMAGLSGIFFAVLVLAGIEFLVATGMADLETPNFQISFSLAIASAFALSLLGTAAGIAPALRALSIKPIDAIRDE
ncbi:MAG: ABC transporter permease [Bacteroidales bacterium]|nr:ABC transporter permease [Bacteroidales bacterium]